MDRAELLKLSALRHSDPRRALDEVSRRLAADTTEVEAEELSQLLWVRGLARHELGMMAEAVTAFRRGAEMAHGAGATDAEARCRGNLAISLLQMGDRAGAQRSLEEAQAVAPASARGTLRYLQALFEQRIGDHEQALRLYAEAEPLLEAEGDRATIAGLHLNRGVIHSYRNDQLRATRDYALVETIAEAEGWTILHGMAAHNLGFAIGRLGATVDALLALDRARDRYTALGYEPRQLPVLYSDQAGILVAAGLSAAAHRAAADAVDALGRSGNTIDLLEAEMLLARTALAAGDRVEARQAAARAAWGFRRSGRPAWAALAAWTGTLIAIDEADATGGTPSIQLIERCTRAAHRLAATGWTVESLDARLWAARLAGARGDVDRARHELALASRWRRRLALPQRLNRRQAEALVALAEDDLRTAWSAVRAGLRDADRERAGLGATEARAAAAGLAGALARTGLDVAFRTGRPAAVFRAAESTRATALHRPELAPLRGSPIETELRRLRSSQAAPTWSRPSGVVRAGSTGLAPDPPAPDRQAAGEVEARIADLALRVPARPSERAPVSLSALRAALGGRTLAEFVEQHGRLHAVVVTRRRARLVDLGPLDAVTSASAHLTAGLHRLLRQGPTGGQRSMSATAQSGAELDELLIGPLDLGAGGEPDLVLVPTGALFRFPWSLLPTLTRVPFTVAPSASLWLQSTARPASPRRRTLLVHGPGLPGAEREVARLARLHAGARVLSGPAATCEHTLAALEDVDLAHLAAHGTFRSDNPMFSSIELADGQLTIHDLERLQAVPDTVVLTACNVAAAVVTPTDELLGTAFSLLAMGVRTVLAPVAPIPDGKMEVYVTALHTALLAGRPVREAHHEAVAASGRTGDPAAAVAAASFSPIGFG